MSDNPTLWVSEVQDGEHDGVICVNYTMFREATRADLLAALDVEWYCCWGMENDCRLREHSGGMTTHSCCHWAVKP